MENKLVVTSGEREGGRGKIGVGEEQEQTTMYKIGKVQEYIVQQGIQPIFYNNYKWSITFKNCESLCCTPETYITL